MSDKYSNLNNTTRSLDNTLERTRDRDRSRDRSSSSRSFSDSGSDDRDPRIPLAIQSESTSCQDCRDHIKEMIRIHELWQATKRDYRECRRSFETSMNELKQAAAKREREATRTNEAFNDEIKSIRSDLKIKIDLITNLRREIDANSKSNAELNQQLASIHAKYDEQVTQNTALTLRNRDLESSLQQLRYQKEAVWDANMASLKDQLRRKDNDLSQLNRELASRDRELSSRNDEIDELQGELKKAKNAERSQLDAYEALQQESSRLHLSLKQQSIIFDEQAEEKGRLLGTINTQNVELDSLRSEVSSLRSSLRDAAAREDAYEQRTASEFRRSRAQVESRLSRLQEECTSLTQTLTAREREHDALTRSVAMLTAAGGGERGSRLPEWLPAEVVLLIKEFRTRLASEGAGGTATGGGGGADYLSSFLVALNEIWRMKMEEKVRAVRQKHTLEIRELRRKFIQQIPYEQVVSKARILRLQKSLDSARQVYLRSRGDNSKNLLDLSLATVENLSKQLVEYEKENHALKTQVELQMGVDTSSEIAFRNGAEYVVDRVKNHIETAGDRIWKAANSYLDKTIKYAKREDAISKLSEESQIFLDELEHDISTAKSSVSSAVAEAVNSRR